MSTELFKFRTFLFLASSFRVLSLSFSSQVLGSCPWLFSMFCITLSYLHSVVCGVGALLVFAAAVDLHTSGASTTLIVPD